MFTLCTDNGASFAARFWDTGKRDCELVNAIQEGGKAWRRELAQAHHKAALEGQVYHA